METVALQDLVKDVAEQVKDLVTGTTVTGVAGVTGFGDTSYGWQVTSGQWWAGSEVLFEEPAYTSGGNINGNMPHPISGMSSGVFTSPVPFRSSGNVPGGLNYFMVRANGRGNKYRTYLAALRYALDTLGCWGDVLDTSNTTASQVYEYALPTTIGGVYRVELAKAGQGTLELLPRDWKMKPGRKLWLTNQNIYVAYGWTLNVYGILSDTLPTTLNGLVYCPRSEVIDLAVEYLQRNSRQSADNQRASLRQQERLHFTRLLPPANLRMVVP